MDDISLQVNGDYSRFDDAGGLALRLSPNRVEHENHVFYGNYTDNDPYIQDYDYMDMSRMTVGGMDMAALPRMMNGGTMMSTGMMKMDTSGKKKQNGQKVIMPKTPHLSLQPMTMERTRMELQSMKSTTRAAKAKEKVVKDASIVGPDGTWPRIVLFLPIVASVARARTRATTHLGEKCKGKGYGGYTLYKGFGKSKGYCKYGGGKSGGKSGGKAGLHGKGSGKRHWYSTLPSMRQKVDFSEGIPDSTTSTSSTRQINTQFTANNKVETFVTHTSSEDEDFKCARPAARPSVYAPEHQDGAQVSGERLHGTAFNFAIFHAGQQLEELASCFNVCGGQGRGLLVDPGAASGLIGSDTLKQLMDNCITPFGKQHEVSMNYDKTTHQ